MPPPQRVIHEPRRAFCLGGRRRQPIVFRAEIHHPHVGIGHITAIIPAFLQSRDRKGAVQFYLRESVFICGQFLRPKSLTESEVPAHR